MVKNSVNPDSYQCDWCFQIFLHQVSYGKFCILQCNITHSNIFIFSQRTDKKDIYRNITAPYSIFLRLFESQMRIYKHWVALRSALLSIFMNASPPLCSHIECSVPPAFIDKLTPCQYSDAWVCQSSQQPCVRESLLMANHCIVLQHLTTNDNNVFKVSKVTILCNWPMHIFCNLYFAHNFS